MNKGINKRIGAWMLLLVMFFTLFGMNSLVSEAVTPSEREYGIRLDKGAQTYIHNKVPLDGKVGTEYFMTYTVKSVTYAGTQVGLLGTEDSARTFPYADGGIMRYHKEKDYMTVTGATYFVKFTIAEGGFRYNVARAQGEKLENLYFERVTGDATDTMKYLGIWIARGELTEDTTTLELSNVRYYDAKGNDMGIDVHTTGTYQFVGGDLIAKDAKIDHYYEVTINDQKMIAISNKIPTNSSVITIEYKVESADIALNQEGAVITSAPTQMFPFSSSSGIGCLKYLKHDELNKNPLMLEVGAEYIVVIEKNKDNYDVYVQKTTKKETVSFYITRLSGQYNSAHEYASLWFCELYGKETGSFKLTNFKMYDNKKNDLGVQCNRTAFIVRKGAVDNYADCEGVYYCKENQNSIALYENKEMKFTQNDATTEGKYRIADNVMNVTYGDGSKVDYNYLYKRITDKEGNVYERLANYRIRFVTGSDTKIPEQKFSTKNGYVATKPETPTLGDYEFKGWYKSDGTEYDFNQLVTESATLYAKWSGDGGVEFLAEDVNGEWLLDKAPVLIVSGSILVVVGLAVCVILIRKEKRKGHVK